MKIENLNTEEKNWATGVHLISFLGIVVPFGGIIGPLVLWMVKRNDSDFVDEHGKEAVNFHISTTIYNVVFIIGMLINLFKSIPALESLGNDPGASEVFAVIGSWMGWLLPLILISLFVLIMTIVAAINANSGKSFKYPLSIRFIR